MIKLLLCIIFFVIVVYLVNFLINKIIQQLIKSTKYSISEIQKIDFKTIINDIIASSRNKKNNSIKLFSSLLACIILLLLTHSFIFCIIGAIIGFFLPTVINNYLEKKQLEKFNNQLVDVLTIISNSLRAGTSFVQSLDIIVKETKPPISTEFNKTIQEIKLGIPVSQALVNLSNRIKSKDLEIFVTTVNIARETGGSLPEILNIIADTIRERNKLKGKIAALTAQGKMSGFVVGSMPFLLMGILYLMSPDLIEPMFNTLIGQLMLAIVVIFVIIGGLLIHKIVTIDI